MSDFNYLEYQAALKNLKMCVQEMDDALDGLLFEHGANGISSRAIGHLNQFNEANAKAQKAQGAVGKLIIKEMARQEA